MPKTPDSLTPGPRMRESGEAFERGLARAMRELPELAPPPELARNVMAAIAARPAPAVPATPHRVARSGLPGWLAWLLRPREVRLSPLALGLSAAAVLLAVGFLAGRAFERFGGPQAPGLTVAENGPAIQAVSTGQARVRFLFPGQRGKAVAVIGSFNGWRPDGYDMRYDPAAGAYVLDAMVPQGTHEYAFLVDDHAVPDPGAAFSRDDGFGNTNSILQVHDAHETLL